MNTAASRTSTYFLIAIAAIIIVAGSVYLFIHYKPSAPTMATSTPIVVDQSRVSLTPEQAQQKALLVSSLEASNTQEALTATETQQKQAILTQTLSAH